MSIPSIILQNIEKYFNESSADSNKSFLKGYENVYLYITLKKSFNADIQIIVDLFTKAVYKKAKKYNNLDVYDKTKYNLETARMVRMCLYMERYIHHIYEKLQNIIDETWEKVDKVTKLSQIGPIIIQYNLPSGEPPIMGKMIGSYLY